MLKDNDARRYCSFSSVEGSNDAQSGTVSPSVEGSNDAQSGTVHTLGILPWVHERYLPWVYLPGYPSRVKGGITPPVVTALPG